MSLLFFITIIVSSGFCFSSEIITRNYFVKGMTCGGCVFSVKSALNKEENLGVAEKDISVGIARIIFKKESYKEKETDCNVTMAIESKTEFKVFLDQNLTTKACEASL